MTRKRGGFYKRLALSAGLLLAFNFKLNGDGLVAGERILWS